MMRTLMYRRDKATLSLIGVVTLVYAVHALSGINGTGGAEAMFAFDPRDVFRGQIWKSFSYGFLPAGPMDFIVSAVAIYFLGARIQRAWSANNLWSYVLIILGCASLVHGILFALAGKTSVVFGTSFLVYPLLVAWGALFGHETLLLFGKWRMSVRRLMMIFVVASLALSFIAGTDFPTVFMTVLCLVIAWAYLKLRDRFNRSRPAEVTGSNRIQRLEL